MKKPAFPRSHLPESPPLRPVRQRSRTPGTATLSHRQVLADLDDRLRTEVVTLFFDFIVPRDSGVAVQISPSLRLTGYAHGDDYTNEYFDCRDPMIFLGLELILQTIMMD